MLDHPMQDLESWVLFFKDCEPPVLRHTVKQIEAAREIKDKVSGREISQIVFQDPLMATRVLAYIQPFRGKKLQHDITTVAGAIMMLGIDPFFARFKELGSLEKSLHDYPQALLGAIHVVRRAQRATHYAFEWATWRHDTNIEEVLLATLLHDLAEILMWAYAPKLALEVLHLQQQHPTMRSAVAQEAVLGIRLIDLQTELCHAWHLPELLLTLIGGSQANNPRVRTVQLAVDLARHSAHGWDDPALPDDYEGIADLLNVSVEALLPRLGIDPETRLPYVQEEAKTEGQDKAVADTAATSSEPTPTTEPTAPAS